MPTVDAFVHVLRDLLEPLSPRVIALTSVLSLLTIYWTVTVIYHLIFSPLRSIPGPWYAAVSNLWISTHILRLRRCTAIDDLLNQYGPIVRIAPNSIIFNDAETLKTVYGVSAKLSKSTTYKGLATYKSDHALTVLEHSAHATRRKTFASHYSLANLLLFQSDFYSCVHEFVHLLNLCAQRPGIGAVDTMLLFRHLFIDINAIHVFGYETKALKAWAGHIFEGKEIDHMSTAISDFPIAGLMRSAIPGWLWKLVEHIPNARVHQLCDAAAFLSRFSSLRLEEMRLSEKGTDGKVSMMERMMKGKYSATEVVPDKDIISECAAHMVGGTDTTSTTLTYILWELSRRRDMLLRLQAELDAAMPDPSDIPDFQVLNNLPYLSAVFKEGLRVYTAFPSPLERIAPEKSINLLGHHIPPGTVIASQSWSSHRISKVFFSPDLFLPDRWLLDNYSITLEPFDSEPSSSQSLTSNHSLPLSAVLSNAERGLGEGGLSTPQSQMSAHMFPFGYGPRICVGQNVAHIMLRAILAAIVRNFDIVAPPETNEKSMDPQQSFVIFPASTECRLNFVPRSPKI